MRTTLLVHLAVLSKKIWQVADLPSYLEINISLLKPFLTGTIHLFIYKRYILLIYGRQERYLKVRADVFALRLIAQTSSEQFRDEDYCEEYRIHLG